MGWDNYYYPKSTPIRAAGGIKAKGGRQLGGEQWWAKRWIAILDSFSLGARLSRGRSYARRGQVLSIEIAPGIVTAKVQGSERTPYSITIKLAPFPTAVWDRVLAEMAERALFLAKLLAGEMPNEIEEVFEAAGAPLFPQKAKDLATTCSCPDWSNPCKHIAAVYYLLGEEFDRDPFLIFTLRGLPRETMLERLRAVAGTAEAGTPPEERESALEPLVSDPALFWSGTPLSEDLAAGAAIPAVNAALLRRLGEFPFWRGEESVREALAPGYATASQRGRDIYLLCDSETTTEGKGSTITSEEVTA